jgi:phasin family protein
MTVQSTASFTDVAKLFTPFSIPALPVDHIVALQRRNVEAVTAATQIAAESWLTIYRRQVEILTQTVTEGANGLRHLWSPGAPDEKFAQHADAVKTSFEKGVTNLREASDIFTKANAEAGDLLAKRVTESLTELKNAVTAAKPITKPVSPAA